MALAMPKRRKMCGFSRWDNQEEDSPERVQDDSGRSDSQKLRVRRLSTAASVGRRMDCPLFAQRFFKSIARKRLAAE